MISVIVLTYNPNWNKLKMTLTSILKQKETDFEVVLADDGSTNNNFEDAKELFAQYEFDNYTLINNKENQGTIKNYLSGLEVAKGEYSYGISPGDFLYDEYTLKSFYEYAKAKDIDILFGDAIHYYNGVELDINLDLSVPSNPTIFNNEKDYKKAKREFVLGEHISGPCYFRKTNLTKKYFKELLKYEIKYVEDTTSSLLALVDGIQILHLERPICWYEEGDGITSKKRELVFNEIKKIYEGIQCQKYSPEVDCALMRMNIKNHIAIKISCLIKHPTIYTKHILFELKTKKLNYYNKYNPEQLICSLKKALEM